MIKDGWKIAKVITPDCTLTIAFKDSVLQIRNANSWRHLEYDFSEENPNSVTDLYIEMDSFLLTEKK